MRSHRISYVVVLAIIVAAMFAACGNTPSLSESIGAATTETELVADAAVMSGSDADSGSGSDAGIVDDAGDGSGSGSDAGTDGGTDGGTLPCDTGGSGTGTGTGTGTGSDTGSGGGTTCSGTSCSTGSCSGVIYGDRYNRIGDSVFVVPGFIPDMLAPLTFTAYGLPPGLTIDRYSGRISGIVAPEANTESPYVVVVDVKDSTQPTAWITRIEFNWWISVAVDESLQQNTTACDGPVYLRLPIPKNCGMTPPVYYNVTGLPEGLVASATGEITGTITAQPGTYTVTVEIVDSSNPPKVETYSFEWIVAPCPTLDQFSYVGENVSFEVPTTEGTAPFYYSAFGLPPGLMIEPYSGRIVGTVQPGAELYSPYSVVVMITDAYGITRNLTFRWVVHLFASTDTTTTTTAL